MGCWAHRWGAAEARRRPGRWVGPAFGIRHDRKWDRRRGFQEGSRPGFSGCRRDLEIAPRQRKQHERSRRADRRCGFVQRASAVEATGSRSLIEASLSGAVAARIVARPSAPKPQAMIRGRPPARNLGRRMVRPASSRAPPRLDRAGRPYRPARYRRSAGRSTAAQRRSATAGRSRGRRGPGRSRTGHRPRYRDAAGGRGAGRFYHRRPG